VRAPQKWAVALPEKNLSAREAMLVGTAGFTAALSILRLEENGLSPGGGKKVIVLGATGGVGGFAVAFLSALGYEVTAVTGKAAAADYLTKTLGASEVLLRDEIERGNRPLEKALWAGAVDPVGGEWLAWLTRTLAPGASVAVSGLTGGIELHTTVMPFILRGASILGVDSVFCPMSRREKTWARIAGEMKPKNLDAIAAAEVGLEELPAIFPKLLKGEMRGRALVRLN
jgi:putative YhdH/YhfP family quinone oxidoreductase